MRVYLWVCLLSVFGLLGAAQAEPVGGLRATDRIVFVGDSITGQGGRSKQGYVNLLREGLLAVHPDWTNTLIPLGGSGQSVGSWAGMEKRSRDTECTLDLPEFGVKATLDHPADVVIVMLGMNDILAPYVSEQPSALNRWRDSYAGLVTALRERVKPRLIGLATITLHTDDLKSPKNVVRAELNARIAEIARAQHCVLLSTGQEMEALLRQGRAMQPDFHPDIDFVHPNTFGHAAIAAAMLQGLGETAAAQTLRAKYYPSPTTQPTRYPALSYTLEPVATPLADGNVRYIVHYGWTPAPPAVTVRLQAPAGWTATPAKLTMATGAFTLTGTPDRLTQNATLSATAGAVVKELPIALPAPWLVGAGMLSNEAWPSGKFTADKAVLPFEAALANGDGLGAPQTHANGTQLTWTRYQAGVDYTGGNDPGSLDFAQVTLGKTFEVAYAARWVYSPDARPVRLNFGTNIFAGTFAVTAYLNGATLYTGTLTTEPNRRAVVDGKLNKGWNLLLLKSNHFQWQWQLTCALSGDAPDDLADLRYSTATKMPTLP